jgi:hypothetical protein
LGRIKKKKKKKEEEEEEGIRDLNFDMGFSSGLDLLPLCHCLG